MIVEKINEYIQQGKGKKSHDEFNTVNQFIIVIEALPLLPYQRIAHHIELMKKLNRQVTSPEIFKKALERNLSYLEAYYSWLNMISKKP